METLKDVPAKEGIDVPARLKEFYKTHYSANNMKLAMIGREDLGALENLARTYFSDIENKNLADFYDSSAVGSRTFRNSYFEFIYKPCHYL